MKFKDKLVLFCVNRATCVRAFFKDYLATKHGRRVLQRYIKISLATDSKRPYFITKLWFSFLALWVLTHNPFKFLTLSFNEFGDFLAGAFAPLAFYWLVEGFRQQGRELQQNNRALQMQADELANAVEAQRSLAESSRAQIEEIRLENQKREERLKDEETPCITLLKNEGKVISGRLHITVHFSFESSGKLRNLTYTISDMCDFELEVSEPFVKTSGNSRNIVVCIPQNVKRLFFLVAYTTESNFEQSQGCNLDKDKFVKNAGFKLAPGVVGLKKMDSKV